MSKVIKTEVSLSEETEKTIRSIVEQAQLNADAATSFSRTAHKQMIWVTVCIGIMMSFATIIAAAIN